MALTTVGTRFIVKNEATAGIRRIDRQFQGLARSARRLAGAFGLYLGARGMVRGLQSMAQAAIKQQEAEIDLKAAIGGNIEGFKRYAAEIQRRTRYGDEAVLAEMAYGTNLGITRDRMEEATRAAVGLAAKYKLDLRPAMMLIGRASQGQTQMLTRYGIVLDETLSDQDKFNELLRIGSGSFHLAEQAATSLAGKSEQLANRWGDLKEKLGAPIAEAAIASLENLVGALESVDKWMNTVPGKATARGERMAALPDEIRAGVLEAYRSQTDWRSRADFDYMERLVDAYERAAANQERVRADIARTRAAMDTAELQLGEGFRLAPTEGPMLGPNLTPIDYDAAYKRIMESYKSTTKETTVDVAAAWRRMHGDLDLRSQESWELSRRLIESEYLEYAKAIKDRDLLNQWYFERMKIHQRDQDIATGGLYEGFSAGIGRMKDELQTVGELGAEVGQSLRDGIVGSITDAIFEARNLGDALREVGRSMARMATQWVLNQAVTSGMGAIFGGPAPATTAAPVAHGGGLVGTTSFPTRRVSPGLFAGAPRLHNGLRSDEFPAILQRGEQVIPRGGGDAPSVSIRIVNQGGDIRSARVTGQQWSQVTRELMVEALIEDADRGGPVSQRYLTRGG